MSQPSFISSLRTNIQCTQHAYSLRTRVAYKKDAQIIIIEHDYNDGGHNLINKATMQRIPDTPPSLLVYFVCAPINLPSYAQTCTQNLDASVTRGLFLILTGLWPECQTIVCYSKGPGTQTRTFVLTFSFWMYLTLCAAL